MTNSPSALPPKSPRYIGDRPWTAHEADAVELVHSMANRILVKARRDLKSISPIAPNTAEQRQQLLEVIENTERLRKADSLTEFPATIAQLRENLRKICAISYPRRLATDRRD